MNTHIVDNSLDADLDANEGWSEVPATEAFARIERMLTIDLVAFEIEHTSDMTPVGVIETFTWLPVTEDGDQQAVLLSLREPNKSGVRWFIRTDLVEDQPI